MAPNAKTRLVYEDEGTFAESYEKKGYRTSAILFVNGKRVPEKLASQARPNQTLLSFLRDVMLLTGSKLGCAEGGCGACTVMLSKKDVKSDDIKHYSVNACLMPVLAADGCHVTTVEGVGTVKGDNLHPIQTAMVELHGSQCGFCTPGIIMAIYGLLANNPKVEHLEEHLDGNLCRCTGYRPIWDAARSLCTDVEDAVIKGPCGTSCRECPERDACEMDCNVEDKQSEQEESGSTCCSSSAGKAKEYKEIFDAKGSAWRSQPNDMFPAELRDSKSPINEALAKSLAVIDKTEYASGGTWFKPTSLVELLQLLKDFGDKEGGCKIVIGNTEVGIETKFKNAIYPRMIAPADTIESIYAFSVTQTMLQIGSCTPLSTIQHVCEDLAKEPTFKQIALPIHDMLRWFASTQIRNVACLGGNLVTASPISDMNPMLAALGATLVLASLSDDRSTIERRKVPVSDFFLRYRVVDLKPTEFVEMIEVPLAKKFEYVKPFKQARRREDDISIVTSGMRIQLAPKESSWIIETVAIAYGGMAPKTVLVPKTMECLTGAEFSESTFKEAEKVLMEELKLPVRVPGGQAQYRLTLAASFLYKFYLAVVEEITAEVAGSTAFPPPPVVAESDKTGSYSFVGEPKPSTRGLQMYPAPKAAKGLEESTLPKVKQAVETTKGAAAVGKTSSHRSGPFHCTGEALYTDDIPLPPQSLQACLILSKQCGAVFEAIDVTPALAIPGVVGCFTHTAIEELGGDNAMGAIFHDEILFLPTGEKVRTVGQVLGIAVAETLELAEEAARAVVVQYGPTDEKIVVSIEDAIEAGSFFEASRHMLERGDLGALAALSDSPDVPDDPKPGDVISVAGSVRLGGQEHFYLETNTTLAVPSESDTNLTIYASTQAVTKTQYFCASTTGTPASKVVVRMKRMGGGFGGKETRSVFASCAAAVAAKMTSRPVRLTLSREVDMCITGTRHAFLAKYKASALIEEDGSASLQSCDVQLYNNGGWAFDLSGPVADRAVFHADGVYFYPNFRASVVVCKTTQPNHTAYRGFGGPQGLAVAEHIIDHLAVEAKVSSDVLRRSNMYKEGQSTHFGMIITEASSGKWNVPAMYDRLITEGKVAEKRAEIEEFNSKNRWLKRGLAILPTKFGIAFTSKFMNQGGALVHLYTDGTVLVSHGGTEMGQGLHTKVCQVAAHAFGIPVDDVYVNDTSTDKVANTIPTAASMSTDMYGMATLDACRQILGRLEPFKEELGSEAKLAALAKSAHFARVDLSAHGFYTLDGERCGFDWLKEKPEGYPDDKPENSWKGHPFNYFTQGVALAEVEIDTLSGNHRTLRADVLVDVGSSINPMIDIGQVEGAFTQGMGWSTIEELIYGDDDHTWVRPAGRTFTAGPGTYKLPAFNDVPETFNVSLMENVDNPFAVHSSKAIGEPPFFLGSSVFFAIKDAIRAARKQNTGKDEYFEMRLPGTTERIRMYCADDIASAAVEQTSAGDDIKTFQPFGSF